MSCSRKLHQLPPRRCRVRCCSARNCPASRAPLPWSILPVPSFIELQYRHSECNDRRDVLFGDRKLHQRRYELLLTICLILAKELMSLEVKPPLLYGFQNRDEVRLQPLEKLGILINSDSIGQSSLSTHDVPARCHGWAKMMVCRSKLTNVTLKRRAQGRPARAACHSHAHQPVDERRTAYWACVAELARSAEPTVLECHAAANFTNSHPVAAA